MKSSRYHIYTMALVMLFLSVISASCRKELCYDHYPAIDIRLAWELEWERDYGMNHPANWDPAQHRYQYDELRPSVPEWVKMTRYFSDGHSLDHFLSPDGSKFEVNQSEDCSILFYNGDTEYIILQDVASTRDVLATATSRSRSGATLQDMKNLFHNSRTTNPPDVIYSAFLEHVPTVMSHEVRNLPVKMQPLVYTYLISFEFEEGIENVALARGALGGMAEGVYLRTGVTTDESSIILFDCAIHSDACRSQVRSFGIPGFPDSYFGRVVPGATGPFSLNLEVKLKSGKTTDFSFDITDQMKHQPRGGVIRISGLKIEDDPAPPASSGFDVDVDGWGDEEEIDLTPGSFTTS